MGGVLGWEMVKGGWGGWAAMVFSEEAEGRGRGERSAGEAEERAGSWEAKGWECHGKCRVKAGMHGGTQRKQRLQQKVRQGRCVP